MHHLQVAYSSERGRRERNEDMYAVPESLASRPLDTRGLAIQPATPAQYRHKGYLFLLADGVGGQAGGDQASRLAVDEVARRYYQDPSTDIATSLQRTIEAANRRLWRQWQAQAVNQLSTTLVAAVVHRRALFVASVGDSRVYQLHDRHLKLLTTDHSWVQRQVDQGQLQPDSQLAASRKHVITRSLGGQPQVGVDIWHLDLGDDDRILLCTDGISNRLDEATLARLLRQPDLQQAVNSLIDTAYDHGSGDNMSAVLVAVQGSARKAA